jgi:hypothetical protein
VHHRRLSWFFFAAFALGCGKPPPPPSPTCTGPDVGTAPGIERLPFTSDCLDPSCQPGPTISDVPAHHTDVRAQIAASFDDVANELHCNQPPATLDVDFTHEEVLVLDFADAATIDGLFAPNNSLTVAAHGTEPCSGPAPKFTRSLTVVERTGDLTDVAVRNCVLPCAK